MYEVHVYDSITEKHEVWQYSDRSGGPGISPFGFSPGDYRGEVAATTSRLAERIGKQTGLGNWDSIRSGIQSLEDAGEAIRIGLEDLRGGLDGGTQE